MASDAPMPPSATPSAGWFKTFLATLTPKGGALVVLSVLAAFGWDKVQEYPWYAGLIAYGVLILVNFAEEVGRELKAGAVKGTADLIRLVFSSALLLPRWLWAGVCRLSGRAADRTTRHYLDELVDKFGLFNDRGLGLINANRLDLERVYVNLRVAGDVNLNRPGLDPFARDVRGDLSLWDFIRGIRPGVAIAVVGPPGCGKTTLLHHVLLTLARRQHRRHRVRRRVPILVELRTVVDEITAADSPSLGRVAECAARKLFASLPAMASAAWFEAQLAAGGCAVLLDGLDEVGSEESRRAVARWLDGQVGRDGYRDNLFLLTSRPQGYRTAPLDRASVLEVQPFGPTQVRRFIDNWYLANEIVSSGNREDRVVRRRAADGANKLLRRLGENPRLNDLTGNPLLLTMMTMVHRYHGALPGSRVQLYAEVCQVLLERWRQGKGIEDRFKGDQKLFVLKPLAAHMMGLKTRELAEADVLLVIGPQAERIGVATTKRAQFLHDIQSGSGLLLEKEAGVWTFAHHSFQEYLTAAHWGKHSPAEDFWATAVGDPWWRETLLLYVAQNDASAIVDAALVSCTPATLAFTYTCVAVCHSLDPGVRERVNASLLDVLGYRDPALFTPAAEAWLLRCQHDYVRLSDTAEIATRFVSQAEFQLFLYHTCPGSLGERPPHWDGLWFQGDPIAPVVGLTGHSARAFCKWLDTRESQCRHRLPTQAEAEQIPLGGMDDICTWTDHEKPRCALPPALSIRMMGSLAAFISPPSGWDSVLARAESDLEFPKVAILTPYPYFTALLDRLLGLARAQQFYHGLRFNLDLVRPLVRALDPARGSELASVSDGDQALLDPRRAVVRADDPTHALDPELVLALAYDPELVVEDRNWVHTLTYGLQCALGPPRRSALMVEISDLVRELARELARARASDLAREFAREFVDDSALASILSRVSGPDFRRRKDYADLEPSVSGAYALLLLSAIARARERIGDTPALVRGLYQTLSVIFLLRVEDLPIEAVADLSLRSDTPARFGPGFATVLRELKPRIIRQLEGCQPPLIQSLIGAAFASTQVGARRHLRGFLIEWVQQDLIPELERLSVGRFRRLMVGRVDRYLGWQQRSLSRCINYLRDLVARLQLTLAREEQRSPAWEGLRIVRERKLAGAGEPR
jgi:hypothetical protein